MAQKGKRAADERLLTALACGATVEAAARQAGVSERTAYRRLADRDFRRRLQGVRADFVRRTAGTLTAAATEAVRTLLELLRAPAAAAVRLGAARAVLEIGLRLREAADLEERLDALEERLEAGEAARGRRPGA
jgi:hypothetical protein